LPQDKAFIAQKWMIQQANLASKPVIIGTQVFDSMIESQSQPTAQEASDVSTCIFDGVDCIMLDKETSDGAEPINSVKFLSKICAEAERCIDYKATFNDIKNLTSRSIGPAEGLAA